MYDMYRCKACSREEYAYKCVLLEDRNWVCAKCYFEALEKGASSLMELKELQDSQVLEESLTNARNKYLRTLRKYSIHFNKPPLQVMEEFMKIEIKLSEELLGVKRKDISRNALHKLTMHLKNIRIPEYFGKVLTEPELKKISPGDYYTHKDYEDKLKTMLK